MPEVNVVLSGMNETCQVEQNMAIAETAHAGMLSQEELDQILPLYLGGKVPFAFSNLPNYLHIQGQLWMNCARRLKG